MKIGLFVYDFFICHNWNDSNFSGWLDKFGKIVKKCVANKGRQHDISAY